eukprot:2969158-Amphidinium_carterae.1
MLSGAKFRKKLVDAVRPHELRNVLGLESKRLGIWQLYETGKLATDPPRSSPSPARQPSSARQQVELAPDN